MHANISRNFLNRRDIADVNGVALHESDFRSDADMIVAANLINENGCYFCGTAKRSNIAMTYRPVFSHDQRRVIGVICKAPCYTDFNDAHRKPIAELDERAISAWLRFKQITLK